MRWRCLGAVAAQLRNEDEAAMTPKPYDISKRMVLEAYRRVRANQGAAGIDGESLEMFEVDLSRNLYKLWNRMSSGSYFPPPVKQVEIPKKQGGVRTLGIATVADRIAQQVVVARIEADLHGVFLPDSYGYQRGKSAADAVAVTRKRCWKYGWVVEFDIRRAFDELDWDLLRKTIVKHVTDPWCLLFIERWLTAPAISPDGAVVVRTKGVPQGSVVGPLLMNLFMHYAFDLWMKREHPQNPFARYADDAVVHCFSEPEAKRVLASIDRRLKVCMLQMHPEKSGIVYCRRRSGGRDYPRVSFTFLGYTFRPRGSRGRDAEIGLNFLPAVSTAAAKRMRQVMREWQISRQTSLSLHELADRYNATLRGWMSYYGLFYKTVLRSAVYDHFDRLLVLWARRKYRSLQRKPQLARHWLRQMMTRQPRLFAHWSLPRTVPVRTAGAV